MKINIAIVIPNLGAGGAEKLVIDIANYIDKDLFNVIIISLYGKSDHVFQMFIEEKNIQVIYLGKKLGFDASAVFRLLRIMLKLKIQIVHTHIIAAQYVVPVAVMGRIKVRIHTVHSIADKEYTSNFRFRIMKFAYKYCRFIPVGICDYVKGTINTKYGIENHKIPCIYNGVDTQIFKPDNAIDDDKIRFVTTGTVCEVKNHKLLVDAFSLMCNKYDSCLLKIIGDGPLRKELETHISNLGLAEKITITGRTIEVDKHLQESDIFVLTSNFEGLPLAVLEAMGCGLPIISTKAGGVVDIVEDNVNGLLVEVGDKEALFQSMEKLMLNDHLVKMMGKESRNKALHYDIRDCVKQYETLYKETLMNRTARGSYK